jgi:uncharacterized protein (DUF1697 family)
MTSRYVAFLRGINLGKRRVKNDVLGQAFTALGFDDVAVLIASGNVVFTSPEQSEAALTTVIEDGLQAALGFAVPTMIRSLAAVQAMIAREPFRGIDVQKQTRLYVTLLAAPTSSTLRLPYTSPDGFYTVLSRTDREVYSVLTVQEGARTVDAMAMLEKEYGKGVTTRNWNTILKLPKA